MEISDLLGVSIHGKDVWKCSYQEGGVQCVMMAGTETMLQLCVDNWDFMLKVSNVYCLQVSNSPVLQSRSAVATPYIGIE